MSFSKLFKPKNNYYLERIGKQNDGGYLINPNSIYKSKYLISFGIFDDWSFEKNIIKKNKNIKVFCFDNLISLKFIATRKLKEIILDLIKLKFNHFLTRLLTIGDYLYLKKKLNFKKKKSEKTI